MAVNLSAPVPIVVTDMWSLARGQRPRADSTYNGTSNHTLVYQEVNATAVQVAVRRPWGAGEPTDLPISKRFPTRVIFAVGPTDAVGYHGAANRVQLTVDFSQPPDPAYSVQPAQSLTWVPLAGNVSISWRDVGAMPGAPGCASGCIDIWIRRAGLGWFGLGLGAETMKGADIMVRASDRACA
jgi:hypothetical protein